MVNFGRLLGFASAALVVSAASVARTPLAKVISSCTEDMAVALTFDDGPYIWHNQVSDQLTAVGAKGTFFMNGYNWDCIYSPDLVSRVKYAYDAGHMVGDHTWAHADLTTLSYDQIVDSFYRVEEAFSRILGVLPAFMRPPYGSYNTDVTEIAYLRNQTVMIWDQDSGDSDGETVAYGKAQYANAVKAKVKNMLFLNHETYETTVTEILPYAINLLQSNGYKLVTVAECLGMQPYHAIGVPQTGSWTCDDSPEPGTGCSSGQCKSGSVYLAGASKPTSTSTSHTTTSSKTSTTTSATPTGTGKSIRPNASSAKCLTAASNTDGAVVELENCAGNTKQSWTATGGTLQIYGTKCLDVTGGSTTPGTKMQIYTCSAGNANQQFTVTSAKQIQWAGKGECLDMTNGATTSNNVMQMWTCTAANANQIWNFV